MDFSSIFTEQFFQFKSFPFSSPFYDLRPYFSLPSLLWIIFLMFFLVFFSLCMPNFGILVLAQGIQRHGWNDDVLLKSFCSSIPWHVASGTGATLADCFKGSGATSDEDAAPLRRSWFKALQHPTSQWCCLIFCCYWEAAPLCNFLVHLCNALPRHFSFLQTLIQLLFNSFLHIVSVGGR